MWRFDQLIPAPSKPGITSAKRRSCATRCATCPPAALAAEGHPRGHPHGLQAPRKTAQACAPTRRPGSSPPRAGAVLRGLLAAGRRPALRLAPARGRQHLARGPWLRSPLRCKTGSNATSAASSNTAPTPNSAPVEVLWTKPWPAPGQPWACRKEGCARRTAAVCRCFGGGPPGSPHRAGGLMSSTQALRRRPSRPQPPGPPVGAVHFQPALDAAVPHLERPAGGGLPTGRNLRLPRGCWTPSPVRR